MTEKEIIERVKKSMGSRRYLHTEGCVDMAERLARRWDSDVSLARRAAYLHDIAKEMPYDEQLNLISGRGIILNEIQRSEKIIHAFTGAVIAKESFGEGKEVCGAIRWHTTAKPGMTLLEKIIWLADLTEEGRNFDGVSEIRELAFIDLSKALIKGFDTTLHFLVKKGEKIDPNMIEARNSEISAII